MTSLEAAARRDILLTGALGPMVALQRGDRVVARVGGPGTASFTYEE